MVTATEAEKFAEWCYKAKLWVTDRAVKTGGYRGKGPKQFYVSQSNDRFGRFDLVAISPSNGHIDLVQVTRGEEKARKHRTAIKKWWIENNFFESALDHISIKLFIYRSIKRKPTKDDRRRTQKHFEVWDLMVNDTTDKVWWTKSIIPVIIPTNKAIVDKMWEASRNLKGVRALSRGRQ